MIDNLQDFQELWLDVRQCNKVTDMESKLLEEVFCNNSYAIVHFNITLHISKWEYHGADSYNKHIF